MKKIILTFLLITSISFLQAQTNVLIFIVDDLRDELNCYGNTHIKSPHIDKLAEEGVRFNQAYSQQAICAPSRMSILTGLRPESFGIYDIFTKLRSVHKEVVTMPQLFKESGYKTVSIGKVYHHGVDDQDKWTTYIGKKDNTYVLPENIGGNVAYEGADVDDDVYKDGTVATDAITTLNEIKEDKFLMVLGFSKPHLPFNAPKKYWDLYNIDDIQVPSRDRPTNMYPSALTNYGELRGYDNIPETGDLDDDLTKKLIQGYYACVSYVDAQVGRVMAELDRLDLRKNTMVIFMSDHGYKIGEYGSWNKHSNMEIDAKVPLIISRETSHADRKTNVSSEALVENVDIFSTIIEACDLQSPFIDGKSMLGLIDNPDMEWNDGAYSLYPKGSIMGVTVTDGEWRYTEWRNATTQAINSKELYYHGTSQVADANVADIAEHAAVQERMATILYKRFPLNMEPFNTPKFIGDNSGTLKVNVGISLPVSKTLFELGENIEVNVNAAAVRTRSIAQVNFKINGTDFQTDNTFPYAISWEPSETGVYTIEAIATDNEGLTGTASVTLVVKDPTTTTGLPEDFVLVANENQTINVTGAIDIAYGANGQFNFLFNQTSNVVCNNRTFGEPIPRVVKKCYARSSTLSLDKIDEEDGSISIYPNPAGDNFTIILQNKTNIKLVEIYNVLGKRVYQNTPLNNSLKIKSAGFAKGIYLVKAFSDDYKVFHSKLIIE